MKKLKFYTPVLLLICLIGFSLFPNQINSVKAESVQYSTSKSVSLGNSTQNSYSRIAVRDTQNIRGYSSIEGNVPGRFTAVNYLNSTESTTNCLDEELYPKFLAEEEYMTTGLVDNNWEATHWWVIDNTTTTPNKTGTFNVDYTIEVIGNLPEEVRKDFYMAYPDKYYVVLELSIDAEGVYVLYLDHDAISTTTYLISPDNLQLDTIRSTLPDATSLGNDPLQDYWTFIVPDRGVYKFYCRPLRNHFTGQLEQFSILKKVTLKSDPVYLSYRDKSSLDVNPANFIEDFPVHVYTIEVKKGDYIHYDLDYLWGESTNPIARVVIPNGNRYSYSTIHPNDPLEFQFISFSGKMYIIIIHQNYFSWNGATPTRNLLAYNFRIDKVTPVDLKIGSVDKLYIPANPGHLLVRLTITSPSLIFFNFSYIGTKPEFELTGNPFFFIHDTYGRTGIASLADINKYYAFYFAADTYYTFIEYAGNGIDPQLLLLESHSTLLQDSLKHRSTTKLAPTIYPANKSTITFPFFNNGTGSGALLSPLIFPYERDAVYNLGFNLTVHREDNPALANSSLRFQIRGRFYEQSPFDGRTLISTNLTDSAVITLADDANETTPFIRYTKIDGSALSRRNGNGFLMIWPYNVQYDNGSGYTHYDSSVTFRISTMDRTGYFKHLSMPEIASHTLEITPSVNYTAVPYGLIQIINFTEYNGLWLDVPGRQDYDWWQFILASNWTGAGSLTWTFLFDNVWISPTAISHGTNIENLVTHGSIANHSRERGLPLRDFSLILNISAIQVVEFKIYISEFDIQVLSPPEITAKFVLTFSDWGPYAGIGVGVAAVLAVTAVIIIRKRRHWK